MLRAKFSADGSKRENSDDVMGWNILAGAGVTTALKIVQWPTSFPTRHYQTKAGYTEKCESIYQSTFPRSLPESKGHFRKSEKGKSVYKDAQLQYGFSLSKTVEAEGLIPENKNKLQRLIKQLHLHHQW